MNKHDVIEALARYFGESPDPETRKYNLADLDRGCSYNGRWLSIASVVEALENADLII